MLSTTSVCSKQQYVEEALANFNEVAQHH